MRKEGNQLNLTGIVEWQRGSSGPQQVVFHTGFVSSGSVVDGKVSLDIPMVPEWRDNHADIHYESHHGRHLFTVSLATGMEQTIVNGSMSADGFPAGDGEIMFSSTALWAKQPLTLTFSQTLTEQGYKGRYHLEWPYFDNSTQQWMRKPVTASLEHFFLNAGHRGSLNITAAFTKNKPVKIDYGFKFPASGDITIELGISYEVIAFKFKVDRVTVVIAEGLVKQRTSYEFDNLFWPFGFSSTKESNRTSDSELRKRTILELYDLHDTSRKITLAFRHDAAISGRKFVIKGNALDREIILETGYKIVPGHFHTNFLLSWSEDEKILFDIDWKDISRGFTKEHVLTANFSQPYRTVHIDAYYKRSPLDIDAFIKFNWDYDNPSGEEELHGRFNWINESDELQKLHKALLTLKHPVLEKDLSLRGELRQNMEEILAVQMKLEYSPESSKDVDVHVTVTEDSLSNGVKLYKNMVAAQHVDSKLLLQTNGSLSIDMGKYSLIQDFMYTNMSDYTHTAQFMTVIDTVERMLHTSLDTWRKLVDIHVVVEENDEGQWSIAATGVPKQEVPLVTYLQVHPSNPIVTITFDNLLSNDTTYDTSFPRYIAEQVVLEGGIEDLRNVRFSMKHCLPAWLGETEDKLPLWVGDAQFSFRLNHSRLLTSYLNWRPDLKEEIMNELGELIGATHDLRQNIEDWVKMTAIKVGDEALTRLQPVLEDLLNISRPLIQDFRYAVILQMSFLSETYIIINLPVLGTSIMIVDFYIFNRKVDGC
ncbi:hypothetical protein SK128_012863 [Halocaridina rubra]|uniref:Uncharacterized protein n=1 Tax=Halocaridina rubra TaxID=373956 RepID=A0AAN8WPS8_HALRR